MKDYVSVEKNFHVQKRLILSNLDELHGEFKRIHQDMKVGLTNLYITSSAGLRRGADGAVARGPD